MLINIVNIHLILIIFCNLDIINYIIYINQLLTIRMKLFTFLILIVIVTISHQITFSQVKDIWQSYVLKHSEKCLKSTGADYNLAMRLIPYGEYVDDHKVKRFLFCIAENLFVVYEDGSVHHSNLLELMHIKDPQVLKESDTVNKCFDIKMEDPSESFYAVSKCLSKALQEVME